MCYHGLLDNLIGIGSTIAETEDSFHCRVEENEEDSLVVVEKPGWCFKTEEWIGDQTLSANRNARITAIFVHKR